MFLLSNALISKHLHLPAQRLAARSLTKDTYICMHMYLTDTCWHLPLCCFVACATFQFFSFFCLVRFKCRNFNAAHITTTTAAPQRTYVPTPIRSLSWMYLTLCIVDSHAGHTWKCNHLYLICRWWQCDNQTGSRSLTLPYPVCYTILLFRSLCICCIRGRWRYGNLIIIIIVRSNALPPCMQNVFSCPDFLQASMH